MPIFAIVIKKADGGTLVKFKSARKASKLEAAVKARIKGTKHQLKAINYVMPDPQIDYDYPYRRRRKTIDNS